MRALLVPTAAFLAEQPRPNGHGLPEVAEAERNTVGLGPTRSVEVPS